MTEYNIYNNNYSAYYRTQRYGYANAAAVVESDMNSGVASEVSAGDTSDTAGSDTVSITHDA